MVGSEACEGWVVEILIFCSGELRFLSLQAKETVKGLSKGAECLPPLLLTHSGWL